MILGDIKLSYPWIKYDVVVTHFTSRRSTAIEWVILEVIAKFSNDPTYGAIPVDTIFEQILQISDSDSLIRPCLINLVDLNAVTVNGGLHDSLSLKEVFLRDIQLTETGRRMQKQGLLPGVDSENKVTAFYDVVNNALSSPDVRALKDQANGTQVLEVQEEGVVPFPGSLISQQISDYKLSGRYQWLLPTTEIRGIEKATGELVWRNVVKKIKITGDGLLTVEDTEDAVVNRLLLSGEAFNPSEYEEALFDSNVEVLTDIDAEFSSIFYASQIPDRLSEILKIEKLVLMDGRFWKKRYLSVDTKNKITHVVILFNSDTFKVEAVSGKGMDFIISVPEGLPDGKCIALTRGNNLYASKFSLHTNQENVAAILGYSRKHQREALTFDKIVAEVIEAYKSKYKEILTFYSLLGEEEKMASGIRSYLKGLDKLEAKLAALEDFTSNFFTENKLNLDPIILEVLREEISKQPLKSFEKIEKTYLRMMEYKLCSSKEAVVRQGIAFILNQIDGLGDHLDTLKVLNFFVNTKKVNVSWLLQNAPLDALYPRRVLISLFEKLLDENYLTETKYYTEAEKIFQEMRTALKSLCGLIPGLDFTETYSREKMFELVLQSAPELDFYKVKTWLLGWKDQIQRFNLKFVPFSDLEKGSTRIDGVGKTMELLTEVIATFMDDALMSYHKIYILDTNVLIAKPDLLEIFGEKELVIIPTKVIDELDAFKKDEELAYQVREAVRQLENHSHRIRYENAYLELLPVDLRTTTGDNLILSVALKYIAKRPIIITDDINMRNKAKSQKLDVTTLNGLLGMKEQEKRERSFSSQSSPSKKNKKNKKR